MEKRPMYSSIHYVNISTSKKPVGLAPKRINREQLLSSLMKLLVFLRSRLRFILLGMISELVYFFYLLYDFPLIPYSQGLTTMGGIKGYTHVGFLKFLIAFSFLFVLFGTAWWEARRFQDRATLWIILGFGGIFALTTIFVYPGTAIDIFIYIVHSLMMVQYHANPMIDMPAQFAYDPLMKLATGYMDVPSPYGPLGLLLQALPVAIGGRNILASLLLLKLMFSAMLILTAFLIYQILFAISPRLALPGALALAWNPFAFYEYCANGHNDIAMMFLIVLAIFMLQKEHPIWAIMLITASTLIKFASLPLIPLFFFYSFCHQPTLQKRIMYIIEAGITCLGLMIHSFAFFWAGTRTLGRFFGQVQQRLYSFSMFLEDFSSGSISFDQAKLIGWTLFGICFLYALWLCSKDFSGLLKGCFLTMFALLAFGATYIQVWYLIWPFVLAILIPQTIVSLAAILLAYAATLVELVQGYIFAWGGIRNPTFAIVNSLAYLAIFFPPALLLLISRFRLFFSQPSFPKSEKIVRKLWSKITLLLSIKHIGNRNKSIKSH